MLWKAVAHMLQIDVVVTHNKSLLCLNDDGGIKGHICYWRMKYMPLLLPSSLRTLTLRIHCLKSSHGHIGSSFTNRPPLRPLKSWNALATKLRPNQGEIFVPARHIGNRDRWVGLRGVVGTKIQVRADLCLQADRHADKAEQTIGWATSLFLYSSCNAMTQIQTLNHL